MEFWPEPSLDTSSMQGNTSAVTPINQTPERAWDLRHTFRQGWLTVHVITLRSKNPIPSEKV